MSTLDEDIWVTAKRYRRFAFGSIAKFYSTEDEFQIYDEMAELISKKYGNIIEKEDIINILVSKGHIFTMVVKNREAFYEYKTGNIGISHYLRLTTDLCHELVHKLGYLQEDISFKNMSNVFKEAGTEYVSATTLNSNLSRILIFDNIYAKFPEKTDANFLLVCLTNQINQAIGGQMLEKSILKGKDYFKQAIIDRWGEKYYINLEQNLTDLAREERRYWISYEYFSEKDKKNAEENMKKHIFLIQDTILEVEFDKRFSEINDSKSAKKFLEELKDFESNRIRERKSIDGEDKYIDNGFSNIFSNYKSTLEARYGTLQVNFDEDDWETKFLKKKTKDEISDEERKEIYLMSTELQKRLKKKNFIRKWLKKIFNFQESFENCTQENAIEKTINNYILPNSDFSKKVEEDRSTQDNIAKGLDEI